MYMITNFIKQDRSRNSKLDVKQLQALLNFLGEHLMVDGAFGAKSTVAVKKFQKAQGITIDGLVGEQTWLKFYEASLAHADALIACENHYDELVRDSTDKKLILRLQSILYLIDNVTKTTAQFDKTLEEKILAFQASHEYREDGCVDVGTWLELFKQLKEEIEKVYTRLLTDDEITSVAIENELSPAAIKAVIKVESRGRGYQKDGKLLILFEGHIFWKELEKVNLDPKSYLKGNEDILFPNYSTGSYRGNQHKRLERARRIHEEAALKSASWGLFQIMGFNHKLAGFSSVKEYIERLEMGEKRHLEAFISFIKHTNCFKALQDKNWEKFAKAYNGAAYKTNKYDTKMERAYNHSSLTKGGIATFTEEEARNAKYALKLEKAFYEFSN